MLKNYLLPTPPVGKKIPDEIDYGINIPRYNATCGYVSNNNDFRYSRLTYFIEKGEVRNINLEEAQNVVDERRDSSRH